MARSLEFFEANRYSIKGNIKLYHAWSLCREVRKAIGRSCPDATEAVKREKVLQAIRQAELKGQKSEKLNMMLSSFMSADIPMIYETINLMRSEDEDMRRLELFDQRYYPGTLGTEVR